MIGIQSYGAYIPRLRLEPHGDLPGDGLVRPGHHHGRPGGALHVQP